MECQFCKNLFLNKGSLKSHQKNAKYCLKLQDIDLSTFLSCENCDKKFTRNVELNRHKLVCRKKAEYLSAQLDTIFKERDNFQKELEYKNKMIEKLELHIRELEQRLENVATTAVSRPTTTKNTQINNYVQNLQPITDCTFSDNVPHLTIDHILKGPEGYAEYALEYPLKDRLICVDYARRKVKFKDKDGNVITDPEMTNIATKFFHSIKDKNKELILEYGEQLKDRFGDEMDTIIKILDYKMAVDSGSEGSKSEFHHDFVKQMCSKTIKE